MKKILIITIMLLLFPINVNAEEVRIRCDAVTLENNETAECQIEASNLSFNATNIYGEVTLSNNLELVTSSYDNNLWKSLDNKFSVQSINLISENPNNGSNFIIAKFKLKTINKEPTTGKINFINVEIGDDNYEGHNFEVTEATIELNYNNEKDDINNNPQTNGIKIIIPIMIAIILLVCAGLMYKKRNI